MADSAATLTGKIYELLSHPIEPTKRRKMIEELIRSALTTTKQTFESRIAALEELAHEPFDFSDLIRRIEAIEKRSAPMTFEASTTEHGDGQISTWVKNGVLVDRHGKPIGPEEDLSSKADPKGGVGNG